MKYNHPDKVEIAVDYYVNGLKHKQIISKFGVVPYLTEALNEWIMNQRISDIIIDKIKEREKKKKEKERGFDFIEGVFYGHKREPYHASEDDYEGLEMFKYQILNDGEKWNKDSV